MYPQSIKVAEELDQFGLWICLDSACALVAVDLASKLLLGKNAEICYCSSVE
jgi:hypothetical protein